MTRRVLVVGAGEAGRDVARELRDESDYGREVVAFLDDKPELQGTQVDGVPVLGTSAVVAEIAREQHVDEIVIAVPSAPGAVIRRLVVNAQRARLPVRIVPGMRDILKGAAHYGQVREVSPQDLLGRETVDLVEGPIRAAVEGKEILVTGAGGSIGSEICRIVAEFEPSVLWLLGRGENSLFEIEEELRDAFGFSDGRVVLCDVRDGARLEGLAREIRPQVVLHAAAHKHVPLMESYPEEAVMVNVVGTANVLRFCQKVGAQRFVMLSTDKAVSPRSIMGTTKRVAEFLVQTAARDGLRASAVRFGNVLGSRGSVVPLFERQLRRGGPLTVTHRDATRYFMTIKEAAMLVVQAMSEAAGGEIFVLDMGEAINIHELARNLIALAGLGEDDGIEIVETGLRPGEKLAERYLADSEPTIKGPHPQILVARPQLPSNFDAVVVVEELSELAKGLDRSAIRRRLIEFVPDHEAHGERD